MRAVAVAVVLAMALLGACGRSATRCLTDQDCAPANPDLCNVCPLQLNQYVCAAGSCQCACEVDGGGVGGDAGGDGG